VQQLAWFVKSDGLRFANPSYAKKDFQMTNYIVSSGVTSGVTLSSGDTMSVFSVGTSLDITVYEGGQETVYEGGITSATLLSNGGYELVSAGGTADYTTPKGKDSNMQVVSGVVSNTSVDYDGSLGINAGKAYDTDTYSGSVLDVTEGGIIYNTVERGTVNLSDGAQASNTTMLAGIQSVMYATTYDTVISGGYQEISFGGVTSATTAVGFETGQVVSSSGETFDTTTSDGGFEDLAGGFSTSTTLKNSGTEAVSGRIYGGNPSESFQTYISSGGHETVYSAGVAYETTISNGGTETVSSGGMATRTKILMGGSEIISSGGVTSATTIKGGYLSLEEKGASRGSITFVGNDGELAIQTKAAMPTGTISGFGPTDSIKLSFIPYSAGDSVSVNSTGIVTISAGGETYNLHIAGATVGETDFTFGSGSILTKSDAPQMTFLRPPAELAGGWNAVAPSAGLIALDFAPKILGGVQSMSSSSHFGSLHSQETPRAPMVIPVSITQPF
jgi:autotransporter passenger strand-loop-strand repeat protein